jgi:hypothetical protein
LDPITRKDPLVVGLTDDSRHFRAGKDRLVLLEWPRMKSRVLSLLVVLGLSGLLSSCTSAGKGSGRMVDLFNGRDLRGWKHVSADPTLSIDKVWSVRDGMIVCTGTPFGYLHTEREFTSFRMEVEYRWAPGSKPGNSGLFSRINGAPRALPRTIEVQLMHKNAGDVIGLQGMRIQSGQERHFHVANHELAGDIDGVRKVQDAEAAPGEWNRVEVLAQGSTYTVWVNGTQVNLVTGVEVMAGPVGLQSEGGEIHFRNVKIMPLP